MISKIYKNIVFLLGFYAVNQPFLLKLTRWIQVKRAFPPGKWMNSNTKICIDGFHRSGSTFFTYYFRTYNDPIILAHHTHSIQEIQKASYQNLPLIICIRHPLDCLASLICVDKRLSVPTALNTYIHFYKGLLALSHNLFFDLSKHKDTPWFLLRQLNDLYQTNFAAPILSPSQIADLLAEIDVEIPRPNSSILSAATPKEAKQQEKQQIKEIIIKHKDYKSAERLYQLVSDKNIW